MGHAHVIKCTRMSPTWGCLQWGHIKAFGYEQNAVIVGWMLVVVLQCMFAWLLCQCVAKALRCEAVWNEKLYMQLLCGHACVC